MITYTKLIVLSAKLPVVINESCYQILPICNYIIDQVLSNFIKSNLKSLFIFTILLALGGAIYSGIVLFFALTSIFFSANENGTVKQNNQSDFKVS